MHTYIHTYTQTFWTKNWLMRSILLHGLVPAVISRTTYRLSAALSFPYAANLVHTLIINRLNYFSSIYSGLYSELPRSNCNPCSWVMRAAARTIDGVLSCIMDVLRWLSIQQRIYYKGSSIVWYCVLCRVYFRELFTLTWPDLVCRCLCSAFIGDFVSSHARTATRQNRALLVVGPSVWNNFPSDQRFNLRELK